MDDSGIIDGDDGNHEAAAAAIKGGANANGIRVKCSYCRSPYAASAEDSPTATTAPELRPLMKCAGCLTAYYCSKEHQRLDWKRHKALCKPMQAKLAAVAAAEAEAQLAHGAPVIPAPGLKGIGLFPRRRYGSNTQLFLDQRDQQLQTAAVLGAISLESSCRSSATGSPPNDTIGECGSASSSIHGSMADLIAATPYHTAKGGRYSIMQTVGNPKRARFPLTVIRERRSSIGSGEAARLAAAAAAASGKAPPTGRGDESESEDEDTGMFYTPDTLLGGRRKRPASSSIRNQFGSGLIERAHMPADRCASDAEANAARLQQYFLTGKKDHRCNPTLNLFTDPRFQLDAMVPRHMAFVLRVRRLALCVASALREYGWCTVDHFLGETHAKAIYHETTSLYMTPGLFADGQLMKAAPPSLAGQAPQLQSSKDVRSDQIYWFDNRVDRGAHISFLVSMVDSIVYHLTEHIPPYRVNGRSRAMIACYPGHGTKYVRHVDNPDRDGRCVTTIYYLNEHWKREHGGALRMYPESSPEPVDIEPLFDRLLFFWSDRRNPHEVLPAYRNRFAITIWYFDAAERAEALAREQREQQQQQAEHAHHQHHYHHDHGMEIDTAMVAMKLAAVEQRRAGAPRSASCAELTSVLSQNNAISQDTRSQQDSPSTFSAMALAQFQQHLRLDSPRQSVSSATGSQSAFAPPARDNAAILQPYQSQPQPQPVATRRDCGTSTDPSYADYSMLLPPDVINKLLALSARRDSQDQMPEAHDSFRGLDRGDTQMRSNLTSPASPEIDPVSDK